MKLVTEPGIFGDLSKGRYEGPNPQIGAYRKGAKRGPRGQGRRVARRVTQWVEQKGALIFFGNLQVQDRGN
ncbi:hypothetical protein JTE90_029575 [Oedothorax gibbosus]|uniref:Uncharacterized protein n=1 Tax=Oedothorax gibbosus TaxID=931172 RepID=A0AAV6VD37_9ARAC|nr:hypothetical protein JTE90_029575 [Oedothorax gibbosus]